MEKFKENCFHHLFYIPLRFRFSAVQSSLKFNLRTGFFIKHYSKNTTGTRTLIIFITLCANVILIIFEKYSLRNEQCIIITTRRGCELNHVRISTIWIVSNNLPHLTTSSEIVFQLYYLEMDVAEALRLWGFNEIWVAT